MITIPKFSTDRLILPAEKLFLIGYLLVLIIGITIRTDENLARLLSRSMVASFPLVGIALWFVAISSKPKRFWTFASVFLSSNYAMLCILNGIRIGFDRSAVYYAAFLSLEVLLFYALPLCLLITGLHHLWGYRK